MQKKKKKKKSDRKFLRDSRSRSPDRRQPPQHNSRDHRRQPPHHNSRDHRRQPPQHNSRDDHYQRRRGPRNEDSRYQRDRDNRGDQDPEGALVKRRNLSVSPEAQRGSQYVSYDDVQDDMEDQNYVLKYQPGTTSPIRGGYAKYENKHLS